jgi:tRNA dimethylallyltransferase
VASERRIVAIFGPTATGKTATAMEVAKALDGEIISADSMAVYRFMDVGTAKPDRSDREAVPFHLIDVAEPDENFNAARFKGLAQKALVRIGERGKTPIIAGGTGLYIRALLQGFGLTSTPPDIKLRTSLEREAEELGTAALHARLAEVDPEAAVKIHSNDRIRIVRALEVCLRTGRPITAQHAEDAARRRPLNALKFGLNVDRDELNRRIDARVEQMMVDGLEREVRNLIGRGFSPSLPSMRSLGYKEMASFVIGEMELPEAVEAIKKNTRRFAKRQLTWFRAEKDVNWIDVGCKSPAEVAGEILARTPN